MATVLSQGGSKIALSIPDLGVLFRSALTQANPTLAEKIPVRIRGVIGVLEEGRVARAVVDLLRLSRRLVGLAAFLIVIGVIAVGGGFALARDRRRALLDTSLHVIAAGVVLLVLRAAGGLFLQSGGGDALSRDALAGVWAAFTAGIRGWALTLSLVGLVMAASAQSMLERIRSPRRSGGSGDSSRQRPLGPGAASAGARCSWPLAPPQWLTRVEVLDWLTLAAGGAVAFLGVREALALIGSGDEGGERAPAPAPRARASGAWR